MSRNDHMIHGISKEKRYKYINAFGNSKHRTSLRESSDVCHQKYGCLPQRSPMFCTIRTITEKKYFDKHPTPREIDFSLFFYTFAWCSIKKGVGCPTPFSLSCNIMHVYDRFLLRYRTNRQGKWQNNGMKLQAIKTTTPL